jgi:glutaminyl-peptide cyclotransferase
VVVALVCAMALIGCGGDAPEPATSAPDASEPTAAATPTVDAFDADRAWRLLEDQVAIGPRPAGSPQSKALADKLKASLPNGRLEPVEGGLQNVVGEIPGKGKAIVLAAHYDTKDLPDFVGANDGAGGTAAVVEIARTMAAMERPKDAPPIRFVLFDGEEATDDSDFLGTGVRGAKAYANKYADSTAKLVLLDFVADKDLAIPREQTSDEQMWADLRAAAERVGAESAFPDEEQGGVQDDHTPFVEKGIPSIDLIDFDFPCWHQTCDDLTAVSKASLDLSGETVLEYMLTLWRGD